MSVNLVGLPRGVAVPSLVRWGMSADADLVYRTLATFGPRNARTLARDLGLSSRRAHAAVDELAAVHAARPDRRDRLRSVRTDRLPAEPLWRASAAADVLGELRRRSSPVMLTPREKAIVELLAEGHTDASAARQLGVSQRTISYDLRALMDRVGVENRFQLGLLLGTTRTMPEKPDDGATRV